MSKYLTERNANTGGSFATSVETDALLAEAHCALADFVGAADPDEIIFGQNMTSLTFALSRSLAREWRHGDEIIVTQLDHDANITPWVMAAADKGATIRRVNILRDDCTLDVPHFESLLSNKTRLVAVGCASNATGGINPFKSICQLARAAGALVFLDAVHFAPHRLIDVKDWDCDFLVCSAYKFFGPHIGILWGRRALLESLVAYRVRPAGEKIPGKWMTGTQAHESIAGTIEAVEYLADLGRRIAGHPVARREALTRAYIAIAESERRLAATFLEGINRWRDYHILGIRDCNRLTERVPTFSLCHNQNSPAKIASRSQGKASACGTEISTHLNSAKP
jgi:cysteine desulfurase family protein (TIGR01976 family)